ncbi:ATP-binding protein [Asticcacaulis sp. EMRT-3]|uniref:sensor histidine kinase n=1 Tax=Asticcacaulis sp. EMRT-3 TaxID=3040349 RepID=UPI0024AFAEE3|nr:ATP-binding protein [Asticcacaulis sp. EMRT-3]MDI7775062.1 PAS domain S-box protein [Asticcacaulis sp. EMRT-3]
MNPHDSGGNFMPHGYCFLWQPGVLWLHVLSDLGIVIAYFSIPLVLLYILSKRKDLPFQAVFVLFGAFILLCGLTHLLNIWVLWHPNYYIEGVIKALTAITSIATLIVLIRRIPLAMRLPSPRQLAEANARLADLYQQSQEQGQVALTAVMDNVTDGIITIDERGTIESFNAACIRMFGYAADEVTARNISILIPEPDQKKHDGFIRDYLGAGAFSREMTGRRKDGHTFPLDLSVSEFELGGQRHYIGILRDISRAKQAEAARERLLKRLIDSNTELERFAYVASHDMQEPLRMMLNFSQIVAHDYADRLDEDGREYLKIIGDSAWRMRDMVQDLLEYARMGREGLSLGEVDMQVEINHVLENLRQLIIDSGAEITSDPLPKLYGSAVQIMRLFQNLIANAIKYQPEGQTPVIHIAAAEGGAFWQFSVSDNGLGIDEAFIEQVFEPFRRLHNWESIKGSGLGLAVCKRIVENHGGRIWVESKAGEGSRFNISIAKTLRPPAVEPSPDLSEPENPEQEA